MENGINDKSYYYWFRCKRQNQMQKWYPELAGIFFVKYKMWWNLTLHWNLKFQVSYGILNFYPVFFQAGINHFHEENFLRLS